MSGRVSVGWVPGFHVAAWQLGRGPGQPAGWGRAGYADRSASQRRVRFWL